MSKVLPSLTNDRDAEAFVDEADLTRFDLAAMQPNSFEFERKDRQINIRFSEALLEAVKSRAAEQGISYQRFIRRALETAIQSKA